MDRAMAHEVETMWMGGMQFNALVNGHTMVMDAPERAGGKDMGPIPKPFILAALAGCTGMDVASYLRKAGRDLEEFDVKVIGETSTTQPIVYTSIHLVYSLHGDHANKDDALQAVQRSQLESCGVSAMLRKLMPVTWEVYYNDALIHTNSGKPVMR
jgi:putative redox protein